MMSRSVRDVAAAMGLAMSPSQIEAVDRFHSLLLTWNQRINLTAARSEELLISDHLPDSVAMAVLSPPDVRLLDVGAGGGLPAIPFAVLRPDVELTLSEPRAKRAAFLRTAIRELKLPRVGVTSDRLSAGASWSPPFDVASSRATFPPAEWFTLAPKALSPAGSIMVFAAHPQDVSTSLPLLRSLSYATGRGHPRWSALYRST
jgi:16S rRNA (guanine527-N7)-methyltransferase